jgi:serine/threonine-protein kinase
MTQVIDGKYELRGVLGEGGTGVVYDAIRTGDGAAVALKVMHARLAGDLQIRGRFKREAAILERLEGDHICPILELGEVPGPDGGESILYMALPKLVGPTFERVLVTEKPIDVGRALDVMIEICAALRTAHAHGIIHRDLKPANVILEHGKKAVVVDFGLSKIVTGGGTGTTSLTVHNMVFGTPEYMSPEQARGDDLDARCDVYAAGIMLYEILTGAPPFTGSTPLNVLTEHLTGVVVPPSQRAPDGRVTPALEAVVMHALARDPEERYPSASALSAAIMHARAMPLDLTSLSPRVFATSPSMDAFAVTMPAIGGAGAPRRASRSASTSADFTGRDEISDTMLAANPMSQATRPPHTSPSSSPPRPPRVSPSSSPPSSLPSSGPAAARSPSGAPSKNPSAPPGRMPEPVAEDGGWGLWIVLWVLAGLVSIGVGVYFALR